jgi:ribulose-5-phosphate 4-epimerase/fuculose-1-phosphate aldolase
VTTTSPSPLDQPFLGLDQGILPALPENLSLEEERTARLRDLALAFRLFGWLGFGEGIAGHITVRDPLEPDTLWVNGFGVSFRAMTVADLVRISPDGRVLEGRHPVVRAAYCIHEQVHRARRDVICAAHAHSLYGKTLASLHGRIEPLTQDSCAFYNDHGLYRDYGGAVRDLEEGKRIATALGTNKAVILANHGLLTVGATVRSTAWWFVTLERTCHSQLTAYAAGTPQLIDDVTAASVYADSGSEMAGWMAAGPLWSDAERMWGSEI